MGRHSFPSSLTHLCGRWQRKGAAVPTYLFVSKLIQCSYAGRKSTLPGDETLLKLWLCSAAASRPPVDVLKSWRKRFWTTPKHDQAADDFASSARLLVRVRKTVRAADALLSGIASRLQSVGLCKYLQGCLNSLSRAMFPILAMPEFSNSSGPICQTSMNLTLHLKLKTLVKMRYVLIRNRESP